MRKVKGRKSSAAGRRAAMQAAGVMPIPEASEAAPPGGKPEVWIPGRGEEVEQEGLDYDPTAYDCLVPISLGWPSLSFDWLQDGLGSERVTFPHAVLMVSGSQAPSARQNTLTVARVANLTQGRHGRKRSARRSRKAREAGGEGASGGAEVMADGEGEGDGASDSDSSSSSSEDESDSDIEADDPAAEYNRRQDAPRVHARRYAHAGCVNRVRACPTEAGLVAAWSDEGRVAVWDVSDAVAEIAAEAAPDAAAAEAVRRARPRASHEHGVEGYALAWSTASPLRLAAGDCGGRIHVWEPRDGGAGWAVSSPYRGHLSSVEDLAWSPTEASVFATAGQDGTVRIWDARTRDRDMLRVHCSDRDLNVLAWNAQTAFLLATGGDDALLRVWDLRSLSNAAGPGGAQAAAPAPVASLRHHGGPITSLDWSPHDASVLCTSSEDNSTAVWDLALERDPEEEAALAPEANASVPDDVPPQLLFVHAGQRDPKEARWHPCIPGMLAVTAADGFNIFKPANVAELEG